MYYMGNSQWWDIRFNSRELIPMKHEKILEEDIRYFPQNGEVIDIACGDGRNTLYLSRLGYKLLGVDFCRTALNRLEYFKETEGVEIYTRLLDLSVVDPFNRIDMYNIAIINHYRLDAKAYKSLIKHIENKGFIWVNGFSEVPINNPNIKEEDLLKEDFRYLDKYKLIDKKEYEKEGNRFVRYIWQIAN
ncbi:MAG: methyltransferase domain-containing protein [Clostridium sp.]